ncbi:hypothetical protein [Sphingopyxis indica]|uniref:Uncharacterized protein n=1 Tax=Sphingopyxis indica TaxID=436663 RepID=A0A239I3D2_9SPHN|nr:hypothetical protein [Sphingopyxis indica]SNS86854.1 hypothetical protein SAMN06295955_106215 [Sphingopyxis indica]
MNPMEARAALDGIDDAQRALALKATYCPPWRHVAFGTIMATLILGLGLGSPWQGLLLLGAMLAVVLLVADDRRRYGLFVNGYRKGATLPVTLALLGALLAAMFGEIHAREAGLSLATKFGIAGIAFVIAVAASVVWSRVYRRELLKGDA